jgi:hypothetical protein
MKLEPQYPPMNRHRREGRRICAVPSLFTWLDVIAVICIGLPFLVLGLHLFKGLL